MDERLRLDLEFDALQPFYGDVLSSHSNLPRRLSILAAIERVAHSVDCELLRVSFIEISHTCRGYSIP
jgi:hypothetical protein